MTIPSASCPGRNQTNVTNERVKLTSSLTLPVWLDRENEVVKEHIFDWKGIGYSSSQRFP